MGFAIDGQKMKTKPYSTPPGTYDLPFTWAFDASQLVNGTSPQANSIYLLGGYGDFVARRAVGFNRILNPTTGTYRVNGPSRADYLSADPIFAANSPEFAILPEQLYPETGLVRFDLNNVLKPLAKPLSAQIAFQGVRREKGSFTQNPTYKAFPKTFTYKTVGTLSTLAGSGVIYSSFMPIDDYDFELHQMIVMQNTVGGTPARLTVAVTEVLFMEMEAVTPGISGNGISFQMVVAGDNTALSISVVGDAITVNSATDGGGLPTTSITAMVAALLATPAFNALVTITLVGPDPTVTLLEDYPQTFFVGGTGSSGPDDLSIITDPVCAMSLYDSNKVKCSNIPILDIFYNGGPGSPYENGALVPPLWYPKDTVLQIDFLSEIVNPALLPIEVVVYLVGKQYIPC